MRNIHLNSGYILFLEVFHKLRFLQLWKILGYWTLDAQEWKGGLQALNTAMSEAPQKKALHIHKNRPAFQVHNL